MNSPFLPRPLLLLLPLLSIPVAAGYSPMPRATGDEPIVLKLDKQYRAHADAIRDDWNGAVGALLSRLDLEAPEGWAVAALYHDTGRRIHPEDSEVHIVGTQKLHFEAIARDAFDEIVELERLIALLGPDMSEADAKALSDAAEPISEEAQVMEDPWFGHGFTQAMFLQIGMWKEELIFPNPFGISAEEFLEKCRRSLHNQLVMPLIPACLEDLAPDQLYFYEGLAVARIAADDDWRVPDLLVEYNATTQRPLLSITAPPMKRYRDSTKLEKLVLSLVVGGDERELYGGKWPLK